MFLLLGSLLLLWICFHNFYYKRRNLPPGPTPWPIVGNIPSLYSVECTELMFLKWRKKYGNIFTFWQAGTPMIVLTDFDTMQETIVKDSDTYAGRQKLESLRKFLTDGAYGITNIDGNLWKEHRRFTLHVLRDFGLGKNLMQDRVLDEVTCMIKNLTTQVSNGNIDQEVDLEQNINLAIGSIINALLFGYRFHSEKLSEFQALSALMQDQINAVMHPVALLGFTCPNFVSKLPFFGKYMLEVKRCSDALYEFFYRQIEEHRKNIDFDTDSSPTDFVEAYLKEAHKRDREGVEHSFSLKQLASTCFDLWAAGQATTNYTLAWAFAYIISYPKVQEKLHKELDRVIGSPDKLVTISNRQNLHYVNAVIAEVQRIANIAPQNIPRRTNRDVYINNIKVDKNTIVVPQISCILYDEELFPKPFEFNPDRFLDNNGCFKKCDKLVPFSLGKRQCLGESLARMELFLFITNLFNKFKFLPGHNPPSLARRRRMLIKPDNFKCKLYVRE